MSQKATSQKKNNFKKTWNTALTQKEKEMLEAFSKECVKLERFYEVDDSLLPEAHRKMTRIDKAHANSLMIFFVAKKAMNFILEAEPILERLKTQGKPKRGGAVSSSTIGKTSVRKKPRRKPRGK